MNQACRERSFKELDPIKQTQMGNYPSAQEAVFSHIQVSLYFCGSLSPQTPLKDATALQDTVRMFWVSFSKWKKLAAPEASGHPFSTIKMFRRLYNKNVQHYNRQKERNMFFGSDDSPHLLPSACPSRRFPHTPEIQDYYTLLVPPKTARITPWERYS